LTGATEDRGPDLHQSRRRVYPAHAGTFLHPMARSKLGHRNIHHVLIY
jgi:hypothetical protein